MSQYPRTAGILRCSPWRFTLLLRRLHLAQNRSHWRRGTFIACPARGAAAEQNRIGRKEGEGFKGNAQPESFSPGFCFTRGSAFLNESTPGRGGAWAEREEEGAAGKRLEPLAEEMGLEARGLHGE